MKLVYLNCGLRNEDVSVNRSYEHYLSSEPEENHNCDDAHTFNPQFNYKL